MTVTYTVGDTREVIKGIADGSVDLIASSPPFLALRSYVPEGHASKADEIGSEANPAAFIDMLLGLTAEWGRVLAPHGSLAIELGDTYSGSGGAGGDYNEGGLRDGQAKVDGSNARFRAGYVAVEANGKRHAPLTKDSDVEYQRGSPGGAGWPRAKSLALIPQLYAVALAYGINPLTGNPSPAGRWLVRNVIVWHRPNPAVGALGDKVRPSTSYIVVATRSAKRWFDLTAVRQPHKGDHKNGEAVGNDKAGDNGYSGVGRDIKVRQMDPAGAPPLDAWFDEHDGYHDTWTLTTQPSRLAHYAMWPAKLAERLILSMCPGEVCRVCGEPRRRVERDNDELAAVKALVGDKWQSGGLATGMKRPTGADRIDVSGHKVTLGWTDCGHDNYRPGVTLDPFAGSGTTLAVADLHGRDAIGIDFDERNHAIYPARYAEVRRALFGSPIPDANQMELAL